MAENVDRALAAFASRLVDLSGQPRLVIGSSEGHVLIWTLGNNQQQNLEVTPFGDRKVSQDQYHFLFEFSPGTLTLAPALPGWDVYPVSDLKGAIKALYVAVTHPLCIAPGGNNAAVWTYTSAIQEDANAPKVIVSVSTGKNVTLGGGPIPQTSIRLPTLELVHANTPTLAAPPVAVDFVGRRSVLNDGATANSFTFALTNMTVADLTLSPGVTLTVWFDAAPNDNNPYPWALARIQDLTAADFILTPPSPASDWKIGKPPTLLDVAQPGNRQWQINATRDLVLKPQAPVLFTFSGLRTDLDPGFTRMYLKFEGLPGVPSGVLSAALEKSPLPYGPARGEGLYLLAGIPKGNTPPAPDYANGLHVERLGAGAAAIFNGGNVGIGTATPGSALSVAGGVAVGQSYAQGKTAITANSLAVEGKVGIGTADPGSALSVAGGAAIGTSYAQKATTIPANTLAVEDTVAIGTTKPSAMLQISKDPVPSDFFGGVTTVGIFQRATDTVGLSVRNAGNAVLQFCTYDQGLKSGAASYIQMEKATGDLLLGNTGTQTRVSASKVSAPGLALTGNLTIADSKDAKHLLELGFGVPGKEASAGTIGYQLWSDGLDIVGGGTAVGNRQIHLWDQVNARYGLRIPGAKDVNRVLELGSGVQGKEVSAGKIAYQVWSDGLDIVGAGTTVGQRQVHLYDQVYVHGGLWMSYSPAGWCSMATHTGQVYGGSWDYAVFNASDARLKTNVTAIDSPIEKVRHLAGCRFDWTAEALSHFTEEVGAHLSAGPAASAAETEALRQAERAKALEHLARPQVGVIAQEVEAVLPEAVATGGDGYKTVNYAQLIPLLIEAIKEQDRAIAAQAARAEQQQVEIDRLRQMVEELLPDRAVPASGR